MLRFKVTARHARFISVVALLALLFSSEWCSAKKLFEDSYDSKIRVASELYLPGRPWKYWKAQLYQESLLNPNAKSSVGAAGICQAMPGTFNEWNLHFGWGKDASPLNADFCITGGAWYMGALRKQWVAKRSEDDRMRLAQASYNAGFGNIAKAQAKCHGVASWEEIQVCLPLVTGKANTNQTVTYVTRIEYWYWEMQ